MYVVSQKKLRNGILFSDVGFVAKRTQEGKKLIVASHAETTISEKTKGAFMDTRFQDGHTESESVEDRNDLLSKLEQKLDDKSVESVTIRKGMEQTNQPKQPKYHPDEKTEKEINEWFVYHAPKEDQAERYEILRSTAKRLARQIVASVPPCADRTAALRKLRECIMTANAAIACNE